MPDFPSRDELRRIYEVAALNPPPGVARPRISRAAFETPGTDVNALREGSAAVGDELSGALTQTTASWWPDSAEGAQLDKRLLDFVGLVRKDAAVSRCSVQFRLTTALVNDLPIPKETLLSTPDGIEFFTTLEAVLPKATVGPLSVPVRSKRADSGVIAAENTITSIKGTIPGAPADLVVTNELAASTGDDQEDDRSLRSAYRNFWRTARKATLLALQEGALRVPGIVTATALEYYDSIGRQSKQVLLAVADRWTDQYIVQNSVPLSYQDRSQALAQEVGNALSDTRAAGIYVGVFVAKVIPLSIRLDLTFTAGADPFAVSESARAAIVNYVNMLPPGKAFRRSEAASALRQVPGLVVSGNEVSYPTGDVVPRVLEKLGTSLSAVTANSSAVDKPLPTLYSSDGYIIGG